MGMLSARPRRAMLLLATLLSSAVGGLAPRRGSATASRAAAAKAERSEAAFDPAISVASGFAAGVAVTGLLSPIDRALFLSVTQRRGFLHPGNWRQPFQGLSQSLVGRALSTGMWFPLDRLAAQALRKQHLLGSSPVLAAAAAGQVAGIISAVLLSPLAFVKYQTWGLPEGARTGVRQTARQIYRQASAACLVSSHIRPPVLPRCEISSLAVFFRGLPATVMRDAAFGAVFGSARHVARQTAEDNRWLRERVPQKALQFGADFAAAGAATAISGPLNYARNRQFGAKLTERMPSTYAAVRGLLREAASQPTWRQGTATYLMRTNVGWGTLRVAGGIAITSALFAGFVSVAQDLSSMVMTPDVLVGRLRSQRSRLLKLA
jgi:hypothetical protein